MAQFHNPPKTKTFRKHLRKTGTGAEAILWKALKGRQLGGFYFRRQHGLGDYIADFYCADAAVVIELDGSSHLHENAVTRDTSRDADLLRMGYRTIRIENRLVKEDLNGVLHFILEACLARTAGDPPPAPPCPGRGEGIDAALRSE